MTVYNRNLIGELCSQVTEEEGEAMLESVKMDFCLNRQMFAICEGFYYRVGSSRPRLIPVGVLCNRQRSRVHALSCIEVS